VKEVVARSRELLRIKNYSYGTEETYLSWIRKFYRYVRTHSDAAEDLTVRPEDVRDYMAHQALSQKFSASTQNQAFNALVFLFKAVLYIELGDMQKNVRAKRGKKLPVVLSVEGTGRLLDACGDRHRLAVKLLYGGGLRIMDLCRFRVKDIDFEHRLIIV